MNFKRGDTWLFIGPLDFSQGNPETLAGWTIESQGRKKDGTLIQDFEVEITDPVNRIIRHHAPFADTRVWSVGPMFLDVQCTDPDGVVTSTETVRVDVIDDQTRPDA